MGFRYKYIIFLLSGIYIKELSKSLMCIIIILNYNLDHIIDQLMNNSAAAHCDGKSIQLVLFFIII